MWITVTLGLIVILLWAVFDKLAEAAKTLEQIHHTLRHAGFASSLEAQHQQVYDIGEILRAMEDVRRASKRYLGEER